MTRSEKLDLIYRRTHRDYKGWIKSERYILVLREGGTWSVPLSTLTDAEIESRLPHDVQPRRTA